MKYLATIAALLLTGCATHFEECHKNGGRMVYSHTNVINGQSYDQYKCTYAGKRHHERQAPKRRKY